MGGCALNIFVFLCHCLCVQLKLIEMCAVLGMGDGVLQAPSVHYSVMFKSSTKRRQCGVWRVCVIEGLGGHLVYFVIRTIAWLLYCICVCLFRLNIDILYT